MPTPRKPASDRQGHSPAKRTTTPAVAKTATWPAAPDDLGEESVRLWDSFWEHEAQAQALLAKPAQRVVLRRWVTAFDQWSKSMAAVAASPIVEGSMGQPVQNPLMSWVTSREAEMEKCERQLGIGLRNLADLGVSVGNARLTAAELNQMAGAGKAGRGDKHQAVSAGEADVLDLFEAVE